MVFLDYFYYKYKDGYQTDCDVLAFVAKSGKIFGLVMTVSGAVGCPMTGIILDIINATKVKCKNLVALLAAGQSEFS